MTLSQDAMNRRNKLTMHRPGPTCRRAAAPVTVPVADAAGDLQGLLDRIQGGTIEHVDELAPDDIDLMRRYFGNVADLEDLFDRLRGPARDDG